MHLSLLHDQNLSVLHHFCFCSVNDTPLNQFHTELLFTLKFKSFQLGMSSFCVHLALLKKSLTINEESCGGGKLQFLLSMLLDCSEPVSWMHKSCTLRKRHHFFFATPIFNYLQNEVIILVSIQYTIQGTPTLPLTISSKCVYVTWTPHMF